MGSGGLFFDFDDDGWIDFFLVDGDRKPIRWSRAARRIGITVREGDGIVSRTRLSR